MSISKIIAGALVASGLFAGMAYAAPQPPPQVRLQVRDGTIYINWLKSPDDPLQVAGYEVVRSVFTTGPFKSVCTTVKGAISCCDRNAEPEKTYYYKVRTLGYADTGHSEFTGPVEGTLPQQPIASR